MELGNRVMADQLAFALITPYTIRKSRTGAVITRLLGRTSAELVAAQMFAPTRAVAEQYAASINPADDPEEEMYRQLIRDYILQNLTPDSNGRRHRVLFLAFKGKAACDQISRVTGHIRISCNTGETIRDTYSDLVIDEDGAVRYFEPAVLTISTQDPNEDSLQLWLDFAETQPALLEKICVYERPAEVEQTLVLIKPDSLGEQSSRPGAIIDMFSRTGLRIIGCKVCHVSVAQALEFYGPVKPALCRKIAPGIGARARQILERDLDFKLPESAETSLAEHVGIPFAEDQFERIVEFMSGLRPGDVPAAERGRPGRAKCVALTYEGEDAVHKIRDVLGPTDPTKAPSGTVRREFGSDIMVNTAHASDSPESARREMAILQMKEGNFVSIVRRALEECGNHG